MEDRDRRRLRALFEGRLSGAEARRVLDELRDHPDYREEVLFLSRTAPSRTAGPDGAPRYVSYSAEEVQEARTRRPRISRFAAFSVFMVVFLTIIAVESGSGDEPQSPLSDGQRAQLADGIPVVLAPAGDVEGRPRTVHVAVPVGPGPLTVRVRRAGRLVHERTWPDDAPGVVHDPAGSTLAAGRLLLVPFPRSSDLQLLPGVRYEVLVGGPGTGFSAPVAFTVRP